MFDEGNPIDCWEITGSTIDQRSYITGLIGQLVCEWERLDSQTWNLTVPEDYSDEVVAWAEKNNIEIRMI